MKKYLTLITIIAATLAISIVPSRAQDETSTNSTATTKKHNLMPFHGKAAAVDASAMTVTVGKMTLNVSSETKITKDGKAASLSDINAGDKVSGSYKKDAEGKMTALMIRVGEKMKKKKASDE